MKIYLSKRVLSNTNISSEAVCVYCVLTILAHKCHDTYLTTNTIGYYLYNRDATKKEIEIIKYSLEELDKHGLINIESSKNKNNDFICDLTSLKQNILFYVELELENINKILNINIRGTFNKYNLFRYYANLLGTFNRSKNMKQEYRGKISFMSLSFLMELNDINSKRVICNYNKILEENELIYVIRNATDGHKKSNNNIYSKYEDRDIANRYFAETSRNIVTVETIFDRNKKRSLTQKYNSLISGKRMYTKEELQEVYDYCIEWNKNQMEIYNEEISRGYKAKKPELRNVEYIYSLIQEMDKIVQFNFN